ncbi:MAG: hypothetical protein IPP29_14790 [Bacteroidetes bacterium]|nr:hypothetical protein [Bacteroidota bacterium]
MTVTSNGCTKAASLSLATIPPLSITEDHKKDISCKGTLLGFVNLHTNGGLPQYSYLWSNNSTLQDISNLSAGTYTVTVTDRAGCTIASSYTIGLNVDLTATSGIISTPPTQDVDILSLTGNLTLTKLDLFFTSGTSTIEIPSGKTLTLDNCKLDGCASLYKGLKVQGGGKIIIINTDITHAEVAVDVQTDGSFEIENSRFNRNFISLRARMSDYVNNASLTGTVKQSTFTCSDNNIMLAPRVDQISHKHIDLINVQNIIIGDDANASFQNIFGPAEYGIFAQNTNMKVYNNRFVGTQYAPENTTSQVAIYSNSDLDHYDETYKATTVIGGAGLRPCRFYDYRTGIFTAYQERTEILSNYFNHTIQGVVGQSSRFFEAPQEGNAHYTQNKSRRCGDGLYLQKT